MNGQTSRVVVKGSASSHDNVITHVQRAEPVLVVGGLAPSQETDVAKAVAQLQGTWRLIGGKEVGEVITAEDAEKQPLVFAFKETSLTIRSRDPDEEFVVDIKPGKGKGEINLKHKNGRYEGKTCHAIYVVDGDMLKICTASKLRADEAADRPTVFSTDKKEAGSEKVGTLLFILKRDKK